MPEEHTPVHAANEANAEHVPNAAFVSNPERSERTTMLEVTGLRAGYTVGTDVLHGVDLDVAAGEIVVLLGASGSGKSTLLRCVAGLHPVRAGRVVIGGRDMADVPVERRDVGLVFQDHALFPHRDVAGNVAFGPRMQGLDTAEVTARVTEALVQVGLEHLATRSVDELSGGEQQRVALARALAARPRLLLLDEPYGSLDRPLRERLLAELPDLVRGSGAGALLVTHDQREALEVADRVAVLIAGELRQLAPPDEAWTAPADADVARFLDVGPIVPHPDAALPAGTDGRRSADSRVLIPRALVRLEEDGVDDADVVFVTTVTSVRFAGDHHVVRVRFPDGTIMALRRPGPSSLHHVGDQLRLHVAAAALRSAEE
jgi:thiamine transport system ATP-binding protein